MANLIVTVTEDFSVDILSNINAIMFSAAATATFDAAQFDDTQISTSVAITGNAQANAIVVNGSSINAGNWTFSGWTAADSLTFHGTSGDDALRGSEVSETIGGKAGDDVIRGRNGADILLGGAGADQFLYGDGFEANGDVVDGGAGDDDAIVAIATDFATINGSFSGIEQLRFGSDCTALFGQSVSDNPFGNGDIDLVVGSGGVNGLVVYGGYTDLSDVQFSNWTDGVDYINLNSFEESSFIIGSDRDDSISSSVGNDTLIGGAGNDRLSGYTGEDRLYGQGGADHFRVPEPFQIEAGDVFNGGSGIDTISEFLNAVIFDFSLATIISVERLQYTENNKVIGATLLVGGEQIGGDAGLINTIDGSSSAETLEVRGSDIDLAGVTFVDWSGDIGVDVIKLIGDANDANTIKGSAQFEVIVGGGESDTINGQGGKDQITGGEGRDFLAGGGGDDRFIYGAVADSIAGRSRDVIADFKQGSDKINLNAIDAILGGGSDAFNFIGTDAFTAFGQLRYAVDATKKITVISGDTDGDGLANFQIQLTGVFALTDADFVL